MRTPPFRLLSVAFTFGLMGVACDASMQGESGNDEERPSAESGTAAGSVVADASSFHAVYQFQGAFDPATGFSFEPAVLQASEYRTADQALWCGMTIVADGTAGSGPVDTVEVVGDPASVFRDAACFPGGVYPSPQIVYQASRALCQDVTVRSFFDTETLTNTHAVIDFVSVPGYEAYNVPGITGAPNPGGDNLPNTSRGLWSYGNLGPNGSGTNSAMNRWIFKYPQEQAFRFNGRVIAAFQEVCGNATDDDCDSRVNEGCQLYAVGDLCSSNLDCVSNNCDPGTSRCATSTCGDGLLNGSETALDCGGLCSAKCANGLTCNVGGDCLSGVCRTGTCRQFRAPAAGEVVVSEVMANPVGDDTLGEWLELTNLSNSTLDLTGCVLTDAGIDNHVIGTTLSIPANGRLVLGVNGTTATNGGVTVDYVWSGGYFLGNSGDEVRLTCEGVLIDAYPVATSQLGYSSQVSSATLTAVGNDNPANSCRATAAYGAAGNFGTPGGGNGTCELTSVNCRVSRPASAINSNAPSSAVVEAIVNVPGLTDLTTRANPSVQLQVQAAYVPTGTDATTLADGNWAVAAAVGGASTSPSPFAGSDLYRATVSVTGTTGSTGNLVYRARGSVSSPWTLCDGDAQGSFNGFTVATAPGVTIVPAAPAPNAAGQLQITEFLINGSTAAERNEFVEFRNTTSQTLDLNGCVFAETSATSITVSTPTLVGPGGYLVLAPSDSRFSKIGFTFIPFGTGWAFANTSDNQAISLTCGGTPIASLTYGQPNTSGVSQQLSPLLWGTGDRAVSDFCSIPTQDATTLLDADPTYPDYGTPGRDNPACAPLSAPTVCYLRNTNPTTGYQGAPSVHQARFVVPGLTDTSGINNVDGRLVMQIGYGPNDTNPSLDPNAFTWVDATPTVAFSGGGAEDQYQGSLIIGATGTYAVAGRLSVDGGDTFAAYCDGVSENPVVFNPADMRSLTIQTPPSATACDVVTSLPDTARTPFTALTFQLSIEVPGFTGPVPVDPEFAAYVDVNTSGVVADDTGDFGSTLTMTVASTTSTRTIFNVAYVYPQLTSRLLQASYRVTLPGGGVTYCYPNGTFGAFNAAALDAGLLGAFTVDNLVSDHVGFDDVDATIELGQTITAEFWLTVPGLSDRLTTGAVSAEQSSLVQVRHQLINSTTSAVIATATPTFDTAVPVADFYHGYTIALSPAATGNYLSRFQVSVDGGVTWTAFQADDLFEVISTVPPVPTGYSGPSTVWINEFHYDDAGVDANEFIELAGPAGMSLTGWQITLLNGNTPTLAATYTSTTSSALPAALSGTLGSGAVGFASVTYAADGVQNGGNDGFALIDPQGNVVQVLSYEGALTMATTPTGNLAGLTSRDVVVSQNGVAENSSLQLQGTGCRYENFSWVAVSGANTKGVINTSQTFSCPAATTLARPCTADAQCGTGQWCSTVTNYRYCAPRLFSGAAHQMDFAYIPAGTNLQGTPGAGDDERPFTSVISRNYFVSRTEVTQGQWRAVSGGTNPSCFQTTTGTSCTTSNANDNGPVENVDWYSAVAFVNALSVSEGLTPCYTLSRCTDPTNGWKDGQHSGCSFVIIPSLPGYNGTVFAGPSCNGYRLLTESEWERAARASTTTTFHWGASTAPSVVNLYATYISNASSRTTAAGARQPNLFGLFDTSGNATEWVWDTYLAAYPTGTATDNVGPAQDNSKVRRGGGFSQSLADLCEPADRVSNGSISRFNYTGLRVARVAPSSP